MNSKGVLNFKPGCKIESNPENVRKEMEVFVMGKAASGTVNVIMEQGG